jgi:hypothetical protein
MAEKRKDSFSLLAKLTALAIVHIFETAKAFGEFDAFAVLPDNAGVSYGVSQFTHRSGSLYAVVNEYLKDGGKAGAQYLRQVLPILGNTSPAAVLQLQNDRKFKEALLLAAETDEMRAAQVEIATKKYLQPAIDACEGSRFVLPMSLAVVYDSMNQGSFAKIRDRVRIQKGAYKTDLEYEKAWITQYVQKRDYWLENFESADKKKQRLLRSTDYRTDFFLAQIGRGNWHLKPPMSVNGHLLTADKINANSEFFASSNSASDLENSAKPMAAANDDQSSTEDDFAPPQNFGAPADDDDDLDLLDERGADQSGAHDQSQDDQNQGAGAQVVINNNPAPDPNAQGKTNNAATDPAPPPPIKDETVVVDTVKPDLSSFDDMAGKIGETATTFKARWAAIPTGIFGMFAGVWAFIQNANPIIVAAIAIGVVLIIGGFVWGVIWLKNRDRQRQADAAARDHEAKLQAAKFAHELSLIAAKSAIDPGSQTIKFRS